MKKKKMTDLEKDKEFKLFQDAFYNVLGKFVDRGYDMLERHRPGEVIKEGIVETLLFTLLWDGMTLPFRKENSRDSLAQLEDIKDLCYKIINGKGPEALSEDGFELEKTPPKNKLN
jgi:hypothetical protein